MIRGLYRLISVGILWVFRVYFILIILERVLIGLLEYIINMFLLWWFKKVVIRLLIIVKILKKLMLLRLVKFILFWMLLYSLFNLY